MLRGVCKLAPAAMLATEHACMHLFSRACAGGLELSLQVAPQCMLMVFGVFGFCVVVFLCPCRDFWRRGVRVPGAWLFPCPSACAGPIFSEGGRGWATLGWPALCPSPLSARCLGRVSARRQLTSCPCSTCPCRSPTRPESNGVRLSTSPGDWGGRAKHTPPRTSRRRAGYPRVSAVCCRRRQRVSHHMLSLMPVVCNTRRAIGRQVLNWCGGSLLAKPCLPPRCLIRRHTEGR